ncbi:LacI family transcriptional regulator [Silvibacterium bohemicum]|uniref:LacI family transcriptional regulator n=1 Tax=Silvibacterium bohemicum TaxID=1577686 RepID=A0A841JW37_9BACT|nr:LacI family DNA-binding transcriptional regulator [Silvibacterium bohemicum]MBB6145360.1 LacI family transcriptional regulator [Silvibacterium bohemicum]
MSKRHAQPTLSDVARLAGVGVGTVSRVVNGGINVSPETFRKVDAAIQRLGYRPNHAARVLKGGRTKTIGLLVPSIADSFFASCAEAAGRVARLHDSLLIVSVTKNRHDAEMNSLDVLMRHRPDGLLLVPSSSSQTDLSRLLNRSPIPVITFDRPLPGSGCSSVLTNSFESAREATAHLIGHGYKRILCFGGEPELYTIAERVRGYHKAMEEAGLPPMIDTSLGPDASRASSLLAVHLKSKRPPDAILTLKNSSTIGTFQALQELGVPVPSRVALLGFDDFELATTLRPAISVVQQPIEDIGRTAAELLFAQLEGASRTKTSNRLKQNQVILANRLVIRRSCGCGSV